MANVDNNTDGSSTPPLQPDQILQAEALEELVREETLRHIDAAWQAQRRLMQACLRPDDEPKKASAPEAGQEEFVNDATPGKLPSTSD